MVCDVIKASTGMSNAIMPFWRRLLCLGLMTVAVDCGGKSVTEPSPQSPVVFSTSRGQATWYRVEGAERIEYRACFQVWMTPGVNATATLQNVVSTVFRADGSVLASSTFTEFAGGRLTKDSLGAACPIMFTDVAAVRPTATTYQMRLDYSLDNGEPRGPQTRVDGGAIVSFVPDMPMTSLTVTHDIPNPPLARIGTPITFTAVGHGGRPPYEFQWYLNGFLLRDWDPNPVLVWDGTTLGGTPITFPQGLILAVGGKSAGGPVSEAGAQLQFSIR